MRLKEDCQFTVMGEEHVYIPQTEEYMDFTTIVAFNATAAMLFTAFSHVAFEEEDLVQHLTDLYEVDELVARADVKRFLKALREADLVIA